WPAPPSRPTCCWPDSACSCSWSRWSCCCAAAARPSPAAPWSAPGHGAAALAARAGHGSLTLDWPLIGTFAAAAVIGAVAGGSLAGRASPQRLSAAFTVLVVLVAVY